MIRLAAQPAEEGTSEQANIKPVGLCPTVFARDWDAGWMDDVCFNAACTPVSVKLVAA